MCLCSFIILLPHQQHRKYEDLGKKRNLISISSVSTLFVTHFTGNSADCYIFALLVLFMCDCLHVQK